MAFEEWREEIRRRFEQFMKDNPAPILPEIETGPVENWRQRKEREERENLERRANGPNTAFNMPQQEHLKRSSKSIIS